MRTRSVFIAVLSMLSVLPAGGSFAQTSPASVEATPLDVDAKATSVTLYRGRASVTRTATINLKQGVYDLHFVNLPETVQSQTLQARAQGEVRVLGVDFAQEQTAGPSKQFAEIDKKIEDLQQALADIAAQRELIKSQQQFIDGIAVKAATEAGKEAGTSRMDLDAAQKQLEFIAENRSKLLSQSRELDIKQRDLEKQLQAAQNNRNALASTGNVSRIATVSVAAIQNGPATIELTYLVNQATWQPAYNIRASQDGASAQIEYDAVLTQRSGEDWDDVALTLSTAQPAIAANPPVLQPWYVDVVKPMEKATSAAVVASAAPPPSFRGEMKSLDQAAQSDADLGRQLEGFAADASVQGGGPSVTFVLPRTVTVKTNIQKQQRTRIATVNANPNFVHVAIPALTPAVYVRGELTNSSSYQFLPGPASIFMGQDYIGPTTMDAVAANTNFRVYFGIDPAVKASRQMVTKQTENTGLLSGGRRTTYEYRLAIDNGSGKALALELWDRYPVSRSQEIQIEIVDPSYPLANDAKYLAEQRPTGLLKWTLNVPAGASDKSALVVTYGVKINRAKDVEMTPLPE